MNIPVVDLSNKMDELPKEQEVVAYYRGPFCMFADDTVELLREKGFNAKRLDEGHPTWMLEQLPVEQL